MDMMKQRVKTAPLLLEGPTQLAPRLGHIYHHCDIADDKRKVSNYSSQRNVQLKSHHHKGDRPGSTISTDSKQTESSLNSKCTWVQLFCFNGKPRRCTFEKTITRSGDSNCLRKEELLWIPSKIIRWWRRRKNPAYLDEFTKLVERL